MNQSVHEILNLYNPDHPLERASTIPAPWYRDARIYDLELAAVFGKSWQVAGRLDQVREKGAFFTTDIASEPVVVVRGDDAQLPPLSRNPTAAPSSSAVPITAGPTALMAP